MKGKAAELPVGWRAPPAKLIPGLGPPEFFQEIEQRSDEWYEVRRGIPTASRFADILTGGAGLTRKKYLHQLAGELYTGELAETYRNAEMDRGIEMEADARDWYGRTRLAALAQLGFARRRLPSGRYVGCSPDSLVEHDGILEIKTSRPDLLIPIIEAGAAGFPPEHRAQCQGGLWLTGRAWCDLLLYYRGRIKPLAVVFRVERDERYIQELSNAVEVFDYDLHRKVEELHKKQERS